MPKLCPLPIENPDENLVHADLYTKFSEKQTDKITTKTMTALFGHGTTLPSGHEDETFEVWRFQQGKTILRVSTYPEGSQYKPRIKVEAPQGTRPSLWEEAIHADVAAFLVNLQADLTTV